MKHLGDITKIVGHLVPFVNVVIGGSPCQDLSVAGKRLGLAGQRSGLFMEQIRIIKEMRKADAERGRTGADIRPRFMVWENVPGAFSSNKGEDFKAVLEETVRVVCEEAPAISVPKNGWPTAGCLYGMGGDWSIAWRVLDAQFWGVPQRRRRIALVADFGGSTAPEILFEREGVCGDSQASGTTREGTAGDAERSVGKTICIQGNCIDRADTAGCNGRGWRDDDVSYTLNTIDRPAVYALENHPSDGRCNISDDGIVQTLRSRMGTGGGNAPMCMTMQAIGANDYKEPQVVYDARGNGDGAVVPTITGDHESRVTDYTAVCIGNGQADIASHITEDVAQTLNCMHDQQAVMTYMSMQAIGEYRESDVASSCKQRDYKDATDLICAVDCRNGTENPDINGTLQSKPNGGMSLNLQNVVREYSIVRRLTPLECERLQGFPDGWTDIGEWTDSKGKVHKECADTARYKALGNSIALPPWLYVLQKLSLSCGADCTMASLFDGIGGFPLLWEHLNGRGTCLWASEIEEFPIAVTKHHFPEVY